MVQDARLALTLTINVESYWDLLKDTEKPYYAGGPWIGAVLLVVTILDTSGLARRLTSWLLRASGQGG